MIITELLEGLNVKKITGVLDKEIRGIAYDSRLIKKGFLFVAVRGFSTDGHIYIKDAISRGAAAVVIEEAVDLSQIHVTGDNAVFIEVDDSRESLAVISSRFYREPSRDLTLIGITGTNGKTTTSYITKSILDSYGRKVGLLGTIRYIIGNRAVPSIHTTPESLNLQKYLREMLDDNAEYVVLEVSSHALALKRIEGCSFKIAAFTNFSQDHLDFHGTMDEYFSAKTRLFDYLDRDGYAVLNYDDPKVMELAHKLDCNVITCGLREGAMIRATDVVHDTQFAVHRVEKTDNPPLPLLLKGGKGGFGGLSFTMQTPKGRLDISSPLAGRNNVYNILMSAGVAYALGVSDDAIIKGIKQISSVDGRFEKIDMGQKFLCILDYAHTEDALRRLIEEARLLARGKVITVFGCGGDRDRGKRPKMGAAAAELSDFVIITSDNPRTEKPMQIINEIIKGIRKDNYMVLSERAEAISRAVSMAAEGDTVLVAGKGHEDYQEIKGIRYPFSDREEIKKAIQNLKIKI